ncbi:MAG: CPBP family intramembrane metalloprotease [Timaviella obliquedivisa GSE-PSE-MK23-08B]|nr:CPBP family intramembrane metalloprotease [Timaviella obliquedivisa GSE-PSE-MK23-08B]
MKSQFAALAKYPAPVRILTFLLVLVFLWLPVAAPIALVVRDANALTLLTMPLLFVEFLVLIRLWGRWVHQDARVFKNYGLVLSQQNGKECLIGLGLGFFSLMLLFAVQGWLGWLAWQPPTHSLLMLVLAGIAVGLGTGFAEELVFRGWMLDELQRDFTPRTALWSSSVIFAALHFIKPLPEVVRTSPQFFGLVLLGLALVWAKQSTRTLVWSVSSLCHHQGRLGLPIGLHGGLVFGYYVVNVGNLVAYSGRVPEWVTGLNGNPLAGGTGLIFLGAIALYMRQRFLQAQTS